MEILEEFIQLVKIDSDSKKEREMADAIKEKLLEIGCEVWEDESSAEKIGGNTGNIYAVLKGDTKGSILFSSHLDRVPNGHGISPVVKNGLVTSQGTILAADDISGVSAILNGLRRIKTSQQPHCRVEVVFTVCEEIGVTGSKYLDYSRLESNQAYVLDSPGRVGRVIQAAPSKAKISIEVIGKKAHAGAAPEKGISALMAAAKAITILPSGRIDKDSTANFSTFEAKGATNVVSDYALVIGEARSLNNDSLLDYLENVKTVCASVAEETGATFNLDIDQNYKSFFVDEDSLCISRVKNVFADMGITPLVNEGGGGMDANRLNANGIVAVGLASGYQSNHTENELLHIEDLKLAGEMVQRLIYAYSI